MHFVDLPEERILKSIEALQLGHRSSPIVRRHRINFYLFHKTLIYTLETLTNTAQFEYKEPGIKLVRLILINSKLVLDPREYFGALKAGI